MSLIHRKPVVVEPVPTLEQTKSMQWEAEQQEHAEKRARYHEIGQVEDKAQEERMAASQRASEQLLRDKEAKEQTQTDKDAIADKLRLALVAKNNAEAKAYATKEQEMHELHYKYHNATDAERAATNAKINAECVEVAKRNRAEAQERFEASQTTQAQQAEQARQVSLKRNSEHQAAVQRLAEVDAKRAADQVSANGFVQCEICNQPVRIGAPHHMSADFKTRCVRDIVATLSAGIISPEYAEELNKARTATTK